MIRNYLGEAGMVRLIERIEEATMACGNPDIAAALARAATLQEFAPGELILREGGSDDDILLILQGAVSIQTQERHMALRSAVTHIGELAVLDPQAPRTATARAVDRVLCARLTEPEFSAIAAIYPQIWKALATEALERLGQDRSARTEGMPPL